MADCSTPALQPRETLGQRELIDRFDGTIILMLKIYLCKMSANNNTMQFRVWEVMLRKRCQSQFYFMKFRSLPHKVLPGRFADKPVCWQNISLQNDSLTRQFADETRWQDSNTVDKCIHPASCQRNVLLAKCLVSESSSQWNDLSTKRPVTNRTDG